MLTTRAQTMTMLIDIALMIVGAVLVSAFIDSQNYK